MWNTQYWKDVAERVIRTAAAVAAASIGTTAVLQDVQWDIILGTTGTASVVTFLLALAAPNKDESGNASFRDDA